MHTLSDGHVPPAWPFTYHTPPSHPGSAGLLSFIVSTLFLALLTSRGQPRATTRHARMAAASVARTHPTPPAALQCARRRRQFAGDPHPAAAITPPCWLPAGNPACLCSRQQEGCSTAARHHRSLNAACAHARPHQLALLLVTRRPATCAHMHAHAARHVRRRAPRPAHGRCARPLTAAA